MADAPGGRNLPPLSLHVPEPRFRPGDPVDYADFDIGEAGRIGEDEAFIREQWKAQVAAQTRPLQSKPSTSCAEPRRSSFNRTRQAPGSPGSKHGA